MMRQWPPETLTPGRGFNMYESAAELGCGTTGNEREMNAITALIGSFASCRGTRFHD